MHQYFNGLKMVNGLMFYELIMYLDVVFMLSQSKHKRNFVMSDETN